MKSGQLAPVLLMAEYFFVLAKIQEKQPTVYDLKQPAAVGLSGVNMNAACMLKFGAKFKVGFSSANEKKPFFLFVLERSTHISQFIQQ